MKSTSYTVWTLHELDRLKDLRKQHPSAIATAKAFIATGPRTLAAVRRRLQILDRPAQSTPYPSRPWGQSDIHTVDTMLLKRVTPSDIARLMAATFNRAEVNVQRFARKRRALVLPVEAQNTRQGWTEEEDQILHRAILGPDRTTVIARRLSKQFTRTRQAILSRIQERVQADPESARARARASGRKRHAAALGDE